MTFVGAESVVIDNWVDSALRTNTGLSATVGTRIYNVYAPPGQAYPFIVFQQQSLADVRGVGSARIMVDTLYVVKAIGVGPDFSTLAAVAREIDTAMTAPAGGPVSGGLVLAAVREEPFSLVEVEDGQQFRHLGGVYRIYAQAV